MTNNKIIGIILAGGKSRRFIQGNKVFAEYNGKKLIRHVAETMIDFVDNLFVLINKEIKTETKNTLSGINCFYLIQKKALGTGHALLSALKQVKNLNEYDHVLMSHADKPLISKNTFKKLIEKHLKEKSDLTITTSILDYTSSKGRIIRDKENKIIKIIEFKNCTPEQAKIMEINAGFIICKTKNIISLLKQIKKNELTKEYYLTDLVEICYSKSLKVNNLEINADESYDVNTIEQLKKIRE